MSIYPGYTLTATPASVTGEPTPSRAWQWLSGGSAIAGAVASTYVVQDSDIGNQIAVQQTETNFLGSASATSAPSTAVVPFLPEFLFAAGEQGVWYDPSDFSTMYQNSTGATPVTAVGQSVGFLGDKSQGFALGPELVSNTGPFVNDTGWTSGRGGATISISGSNLRLTSTTGAAADIQFTLTGLTVGATYRLSYNGIVGTSPNIRLRASSVSGLAGGNVVDIVFTTNASGDILFVANAATMYVGFLAGFNAIGQYIEIVSFGAKILPGNHATQATAASRPVLARVPFGGRRNLLTYTEQFDNGVWSKNNVTISGDTVTATGVTAQTLQLQTVISGAAYTLSAKAKAGTAPFIYLLMANYDGAARVWFDLVNGTVGTATGFVSGAISGPDADGFYRCEARGFTTVTDVAGSAGFGITDANNSLVASASTTIRVKELQLEVGSTATTYQRVVTAFDVTEAGVADCYYLSFDGSDDFLVTGNIDFSATDEMTVIAGVRKLSDATIGVMAETTASIGSNNGSVAIYAPATNGTATYQWLSRGTALAAAPSPASYTAPTSNVLTGLSDISADSAILRLNGTQVATSAADQGTGNYANAPLYIGRRGGTTLPFNGQIYGLIVRGKTTAGAVLTNAENYMAGETGVYTLEQLNRFATLDASGVSYNAYGAADENSNNYLVPKTVLAADGTPYSVL